MRLAAHRLVLSCLAVGAAMSAGATPQRRGLEVASTLLTSTEMDSVVFGDFDGDSMLDLAGSFAYGEVQVLLYRGPGIFEPASQFRVGYDWGSLEPKVVAAVDQDGDGALDIVLRWSSLVWVAFGHGDGTFTPTAATLLPDGAFRSWRAGDLDGDGTLDFVDAEGGQEPVRVYLGARDGTFGLAASIALPSSLQASEGELAIGDFDGDGRNDIFVRCSGGALGNGVGVCYWNEGDGTFLEQRLSPPLQFTIGLRPLDFDGDGVTDVVGFSAGMIVAYRVVDRVPSMVASVLPGFVPGNVVLGRPDLDGDGLRDLVIVDQAVNIIWGREDGTLVDRSRYSFPGGGSNSQLVDVNGDGAMDIVSESGGAVLYGRRGDRRLHAAAAFVRDVRQSAGVSLAELNGDGHPDLLVDDIVGNRTVVLLADGAGAFSEGPSYASRAGLQGVPVVADLDGDGLPDLAVDAGGGSDATVVLFGDGTGGFGGGRLDLDAGRPVAAARVADASAPSLVLRSASEVRLVAVSRARYADVSSAAGCENGDVISAVDLGATSGADLVIGTRSHGARLVRRTPDGWAEFATVPFFGEQERDAIALESAPGVPRYLLIRSESEYRVYDPTAGGELAETASGRNLAGSIGAMKTVDFDGDGLRDLVLTAGQSHPLLMQTFIYRSLGDGTLEPYGRARVTYSYGPGTGAGDLDGDGLAEVVVVTEAGVEVLRNTEAEPTLRCVVLPSLANQDTPVRVVVNAVPANPGILSVSLDGMALRQWQWPVLAAVPLPLPLPLGARAIGVHYVDEEGGDSDIELTLDVRPRPPRHGLPRPRLPAAVAGNDRRR